MDVSVVFLHCLFRVAVLWCWWHIDYRPLSMQTKLRLLMPVSREQSTKLGLLEDIICM